VVVGLGSPVGCDDGVGTIALDVVDEATGVVSSTARIEKPQPDRSVKTSRLMSASST